MRAVIQRVMKASVTVGDEVVSSIGKGLCVLVGINRTDNQKDLDFIVRKIVNIRLFDDEHGKRWAKSAKDLNLEILCVSQFTLYSVMKGNKPDFHLAMGGEDSESFYNEFLSQMRSTHKPELIKDGKFGAYMQVNIQNDGPVTIEIESPPQVQNDATKRRDERAQKYKPKAKGKEQQAEAAGNTDSSLAEATKEKLSTS